MTDLTDNAQVVYLLGKLEGQVRELVHSVNNTAQLLNGLSDKVNSSAGIPGKVKDNTDKITALEVRVTALERVDARTEGAMGLGSWLIRLVPPAAFGAAAAAAFKLLS